jgi:hypothetical protein
MVPAAWAAEKKYRRNHASNNKPVVPRQAHSGLIAIFAEHSTHVRSVIIISA